MRYWLFLLVSFLIACGGRNDAADSAKATLSAGTAFDVQQVEVVDAAGVQQLISKRNGKTLFLNLWATWCVPCVEEFPEIVKLANEMAESDVEFMAISLDYPDEVESKIIPFLRENKVPFKVLVAEAEDQDAFINAVATDWNGGLPATLIFDAIGKRQAFLLGQQSYDEFKKELMKTTRTRS